MPKHTRKPPPDGFELIEDTLDLLDMKMRQGEDGPRPPPNVGEGTARCCWVRRARRREGGGFSCQRGALALSVALRRMRLLCKAAWKVCIACPFFCFFAALLCVLPPPSRSRGRPPRGQAQGRVAVANFQVSLLPSSASPDFGVGGFRRTSTRAAAGRHPLVAHPVPVYVGPPRGWVTAIGGGGGVFCGATCGKMLGSARTAPTPRRARRAALPGCLVLTAVLVNLLAPHRIHHQKSRYIFDLFHKRKAISRGEVPLQCRWGQSRENARQCAPLPPCTHTHTHTTSSALPMRTSYWYRSIRVPM